MQGMVFSAVSFCRSSQSQRIGRKGLWSYNFRLSSDGSGNTPRYCALSKGYFFRVRGFTPSIVQSPINPQEQCIRKTGFIPVIVPGVSCGNGQSPLGNCAFPVPEWYFFRSAPGVQGYTKKSRRYTGCGSSSSSSERQSVMLNTNPAIRWIIVE